MKYLRGEKFLMPHQDEPFNGDHHACTKFKQLRDQFGITTAVELGCCVGGTTRWLAQEFQKVYAIEIVPSYLAIAVDRVGDLGDVQFIAGDTVTHLPDLVKFLDDKTIFHIDSHWGPENPLLAELEIIANSKLRPVIEIHDFQVPGHPELGFDTYDKIVYNWQWIAPSVVKIYGAGGFDVTYNSKASGAKRGMIYITPQ